MTTVLVIADYDVVFLSYDEPNADANWADLLTKIPTAQRVHGVKGSDSAHKAVAQLATTERVIVIDADNILEGNFLHQIIELDDTIDYKKRVLSWPSRNIINGLEYGNGGIKCWPRQLMLDMRTHENATDTGPQIDFCWDIEYVELDKCYSTIHNNASPRQAWRAGFREGVKLSLDQGCKLNHLSDMWHGNLPRLNVWMTVGSDVPNGIWSILGARQGCYLTHFTEWDYTNVNDFEYLNTFWKNHLEGMSEHEVNSAITMYGQSISQQLEVGPLLDTEQSKFAKSQVHNISRQLSNVRSYEEHTA